MAICLERLGIYGRYVGGFYGRPPWTYEHLSEVPIVFHKLGADGMWRVYYDWEGGNGSSCPTSVCGPTGSTPHTLNVTDTIVRL